MTGIERLREFVAGISPITVVCGVTRTSYDREHMEVAGKRLRDFLADIANQIEREQGERVSRVRILAVVTKMERHVLGHEGMEDSPVARWARELREALGGEGDSVADSPYDAIIPEDAEAVAWVREHGGIEVLRRMFQDSDSRRVELCGALGIDLDKGWSDAMAAMRLRLMPEGMEWLVEAWPRFEDGEPLRVGDEVCGGGRAFIVDHVVLFSNGESTVCAEADMDSGKVRDYARVRPSYRLKRPAPKVLDADGVEVEVGDNLYSVEGMLKFHVSAIDKKSGRIATEAMFALDKWADPKMYTHRAPVLASDGKPLREGETVWSVDSGTRYTVEKITDELIPIKCRSEMGSTVSLCPSQLTHQRPALDADGVPYREGDEVWEIGNKHLRKIVSTIYQDPETGEPLILCDGEYAVPFPASKVTHTKPEPPDSLERIADEIDRLREDVALHLGDYLYDSDGNDSIQFSMECVAKRCRALAERERGE